MRPKSHVRHSEYGQNNPKYAQKIRDFFYLLTPRLQTLPHLVGEALQKHHGKNRSFCAVLKTARGGFLFNLQGTSALGPGGKLFFKSLCRTSKAVMSALETTMLPKRLQQCSLLILLFNTDIFILQYPYLVVYKSEVINQEVHTTPNYFLSSTS
jgi:hypothetical protein